MFTINRRRNRRRFQPTLDALSQRIAPSVYLPPMDTSLDDCEVLEVIDAGAEGEIETNLPIRPSTYEPSR